MRIEELLRLAKWFNEKIIDEGILDDYNKLHSIISANARTAAKNPFEEEKEKLFSKLEQIDYNLLTFEQIKLLEDLNIRDLLGKNGTKELHELISSSGIDIASVAKHLSDYCNSLNEAKQFFDSIASTLGHYYQTEKLDEIDCGNTLIRVYFQNKACISNLSDFKEWGNDWYQIGWGFAVATETAPEDIRVVGAERGSIVVDLLVAASLAGVLSRAIVEILNVVQRIVDIRVSLLTIENLKLQNKSISKELQKELDNEKESGSERVLKILCKELKIKKNDGDKRNALKKSIELLMKFSDDGGKLDFLYNDVPEEDDDVELQKIRDDVLILEKNVNKIHELEHKLKMIEGDVLLHNEDVDSEE